jgi:hypothetical protein
MRSAGNLENVSAQKINVFLPGKVLKCTVSINASIPMALLGN